MECRFAFLLAVQILCILSQGDAQFEEPPYYGYGESPYGFGGGPYVPPEDGYMPPSWNGSMPKVNCSELICGEGSCNSSFTSSKNGSSYSYSYSYNYSGSLCECDSNWLPFFTGSSISPSQYRPCVIPACNFSSSLAEKCKFNLPNRTIPDASNESALVDPCAWTDCGMGTCVKLSDYRYECRCQKGFQNLFDDLAFPCMNQCMITDECAEETGAKFTARSTAGGDGGGSPSDDGKGGGAANVPGKLVGLFLAMVCMTVA